jgi:hypothetical protein
MHPPPYPTGSRVGLIMSRYKSGKLPKTFKIIPSLANWEEILYLTRPDTWTPQATYEATRVFTSNLKADMAQRFFTQILLERVRLDIEETKKLNVHLYNAVKKSLYKPGAFFKGFLLPLCAEGCTLREAAILGSVLAKVSIPVLHSAAGLLKIAEMEYTGTKGWRWGGIVPCTFVFHLVALIRPFTLMLILALHARTHTHTHTHTRARVYRSQLPVHPHPARQKVRPSLQGDRRPRLPLPALQA